MIEHLAWDSDHFGFSIGSAGEPVRSSAELGRLMDELHGCDEDLVYAFLPLSRMDLISSLLGTRGARLADVRVEMELDLQGSRDSGEIPGELVFRNARRTDSGEAAELASRCFRGGTRFYRDPGIDNGLCDLLYGTWAEKDILDGEDTCLVCLGEEGLIGFCTAAVSDGGEARLGLIGVSPEARGRGVGKGLLGSVAGILREKGCSKLAAVTQLYNTGAVRMYGRAGFLLRSATAVVHLWRNSGGS
ncbi:MAG: GNAT family N-acetyltransferase [Candidatus Fermentibacteraceae bacterium]|nr:GNAT family N-acetyltransferase [Candidatus Fermentibacteraceae bacterium]MBN2609083.1 GNAT family N-acetyltransferase [Candidatus Fermentibacteraceae bacterium]